jgi:hypothetical protein
MDNRHHNMPPLAERLELDHASLSAQAAEAAAMVPAALDLITSDEDAAGYVETARAVKDVGALVEAARKKEKESILRDGRIVDAYFAKLSGPISAAQIRVVKEINTYQQAKLQAEREREEKERKAAELFDEPPPAPVMVKDAARITTIGAKASASRRWVHAVVDPLAVPRQYLCVNEAAVKAAIAGGMREIPGIKIFEEIRTSIR